MAWQVGVRSDGRARITERATRERILRSYRDGLRLEELDGFPILNAALVYEQFEVSPCTSSEGDQLTFGFLSSRGKAIRFDDHGTPSEAGDRTISSLLGSIHYHLGPGFNRFFSRTDQSGAELFPRPYGGYSRWLDQDQLHHLGWGPPLERLDEPSKTD